MKKKSLKSRLSAGELTVGSWITLGHSSIAEIMAKTGFDWLTVDMEHSAITMHEAQQLIQVIDLCGVVPLVRVGENNPTLIKRAMDAGAHGVIVPMVNSKDDAIKAVKSVKYPPIGTRGVGLGRAQGYGFEFERYRDWVNTHSIVVVQIEHIEAVNNLEDILNVEGVDASIVGPYDLSGSMGRPGEFDHPDVEAAIKRYEAVCRKMKKAMGFHIVKPDIEKSLIYRDRGYVFLAVGLDTLYLGENCLKIVESLKK
ncbi:MAG: HpcH/HpaI aldolase family protein [Dissulfurispiraceae bacterium]